MKKKKSIPAQVQSVVIGIIFLFLFSCSQPILPNGYKLLCSTDGKKFTIWFPYENRISVNVFDSKSKAIEYAIFWEKVHLQPLQSKFSDGYQRRFYHATPSHTP